MLPTLAAAALACISAVHDGDTVRLCNGERVRLAAIDAPEMPGSPKCESHRRARSWCDYRLAVRSRDELERLLRRGPVRIERTGRDIYGRTLARLTVNGRDVGEALIARGLARRWP